MNRQLKIGLIVIASILLMLIITNPTLTNFKETTEDYSLTPISYNNIDLYHTSIRQKTFNAYIFSGYQIQTFAFNGAVTPILTKKYIGISGNFYIINQSKK